MTGKSVHLTAYGAENPAFLMVPQSAPTPNAGKVVVKMSMCPVNPADIFSIMGVYPGFQPSSLPAVPGLEGCGTIHSVGEGVTAVAVGQRVVPFLLKEVKAGNGSWQEYVEVDAGCCFIIPDGVPDESAAQFVVNPFTAYSMIKDLGAPQGGWIIQTAAGSVLGRQVIQMCKHMGLKTINIVRRAELVPELTALGADCVVLESDDIPAKVKEVTGGSMAWGGIDAVGGGLTAKVTGSIRNDGTVLIYGAMSGLQFTGSIVDALFRNVTTRGFWITTIAGQLGMERMHALANELWALMTAGVVVPYAGTKYPVEQIKEAVAESQKVARGGKVLITF